MNSVDDSPPKREGLPHSEIAGSKRICRSPTLIAAYHVLHRLSVPRHPSCALGSLTTRNCLAMVHIAAHGATLPPDRPPREGANHGRRDRTGPCRRDGPPVGSTAFLSLSHPMHLSKITVESNRLEPVPRRHRRRADALAETVRCRRAWWAYLDLNQGPRPYQGRALTN